MGFFKDLSPNFFKDKLAFLKDKFAFYNDKFFAQSFVLLMALNSLYIVLAQFYNLPKLFDAYWFYSFFYREIMLFCTYFMGFCVIYAIPFTLLKKAFVCLVCVASTLLLIINIFLALNFDATLNDYLVGVALQSDPNETKEFLHSYFSLKFTLCTATALVFCALSFKFGGAIFAKFIRRKNGVKALYTGFAMLFIALVFIHIVRIRPHYERSSDVIYNAAVSCKDALEFILQASKEYEQIATNFDAFIKDINVSKAPQDRQIQNIVLIIGESVQRNLMQIYGYYLPNTPKISDLKAKKPENVLVFSDVIAPQATTYEALSQVLSFANQDALQKPWFEHLNLVDAMKLGGYKAINISNQERFSLFSKASTTIFGRCDETHYTSLSASFENSKPDEVILPILDKVKAAQNPTTAVFYSIHLMGNHAVYYNRYPSRFARFKASDISTSRGDLKAAKILAHYANALLYTDFVLDEIIKRFANSDSIVIYLSDHSDDVFDAERTHIIHSDSKINRFIVEIPFLVYVSDEFIAKHPQIHARLKAALGEPFMSDDLMHTIIDIAGFDISGFEPKRSLISDDKTFLRQRKRLVGKKADKDYDKDLKAQQRVD